MTITRISSGGAFEAKIRYCRAVVASGLVRVAGTVAVPDVPDDVAAQCKSALGIMERALAEAGVTFAGAARVRYILPNHADFAPCWPVLAATFGDNPPAATMVSAVLIDPKYKIKIGLTALAPDA